MYNAAGYPPKLRRPQGTEPGIHDADPCPRCYRCGQIDHFVANCRATVTLVDNPNPPRTVYQGHFATNTAQSTTPLLPTPDPIPQQ